MAAAQTLVNKQIIDTSEGTALKVRKVLAPTSGACRWYRIYCESADLYLERNDVTDAGDRGSSYETLKAGTVHVLKIARGEFGLSCSSTSQAVQITAMTQAGPG